MQELFITIAVFYGIFMIFKLFTSFFLKRKLIKAGHFDKASILESHVGIDSDGANTGRLPALKWGLIALFGGIGLIVMDFIKVDNPEFFTYQSVLPYGIFMVSIALGFLLYFFIVNYFMKSVK
ncbi:MAG: hypothetical protein JXA53_08035 [Bacteroidales bacterium]|nr:hypothetical protein [Bacteroidales bacterium]